MTLSWLVLNDGDPRMVSVSLAQSEVAPVRAVSLPNLDLCGDLLLVRCTSAVLEN